MLIISCIKQNAILQAIHQDITHFVKSVHFNDNIHTNQANILAIK